MPALRADAMVRYRQADVRSASQRCVILDLTARNRGPMLSVLQPRLHQTDLVLEIAAGAGEHAVYNAAASSGLMLQPTDSNPMRWLA